MKIAIDFDGVIFDKFNGKMIEGAQAIRKFKAAGHEVTVFTNRPDYDYSIVSSILDNFGIPYDRLICGKPSYDLFIDDRATKFSGWDKEYIW